MKIESEELESYIGSSLTAINRAVTKAGFSIAKNIEFNLAIINSRSGEAGLKIYVAKAGARLKSEEISHLKFEVRPNPLRRRK